MREFNFYLEAWKFCYLNNIPLNKIQKKSWSSWIVESGSMKVVDIPISQAA